MGYPLVESFAATKSCLHEICIDISDTDSIVRNEMYDIKLFL